jgi:uncharacterized RDD family membrane protein YckC
MSDPNQNPRPDENQPPSTPPPSAPPSGQGSYGTTPPPPPPPGGWQQPGDMPPPVQGPTGGIGQPADLMPRFAARLIDFVLLAVVNGILVSLVVVGVLLDSDAGSLTGWGLASGNSYSAWAASAVSTLVTAAITLGYFTVMESSRGQTVGKMLLKLETRGPGGGHPTVQEALKRNAFTVINVLGIVPFAGFIAGIASLVAVIMIAVTINNDTSTRRGWHDRFAGGTTVVRVG